MWNYGFCHLKYILTDDNFMASIESHSLFMHVAGEIQPIFFSCFILCILEDGSGEIKDHSV